MSLPDAPAISRHPAFVGREEVIFEIDRLLTASTSWVLVTGTPGTGKTALLQHYVDRLETAGLGGLLADAERLLLHRQSHTSPHIQAVAQRLVTKTRQGRRLVPHHFIPGEQRPRDVMMSLAAQVEELFPNLGDAETRGADQYLANLLDRVSVTLQRRRQQLVLVTDGLDQSDDALEEFARLIPVAPAGVTVVCSGRPLKHTEYGWMLKSGSFERIDLDDEQWLPSNHSTCVRYAEKARDELHPGLNIDAVVAAARGSIRYVVDLITELRERPHAPLDRTPPNFRGYLEGIWDVVNELPDEHRSIARAGLAALASTDAPLSHADLSNWAGWNDSTVAQTFVRLMRQYLVRHAPEPHPTYRLFHPAFDSFVKETLIVEKAVQGGSNELTPLARVPISRSELAGPIEARYFLGVGADDYVEPQLRDLGFCGNDVTGLATALSPYKYSVTTLHDRNEDRSQKPTLPNIRAALAAMRGRFNRNDFLWAHFSCHGMLGSDGTAYLLATDSRSVAPKETGIAVSDVVGLMKASGALRWLLTLDACHAGLVTGRDGTVNRLDPVFIHNVNEVADGGAVLAASTAAQRAEDSSTDSHGVFTTALLQTLSRCASGSMLTLDSLKDSVVNLVASWDFGHLTDAQPQTPSFRIEGTGDLIVLDRRGL